MSSPDAGDREANARRFWERHPAPEAPPQAWHATVKAADCRTPADLRATFRSADFVADDRVIFDIPRNRDRLIARFAYRHRAVLVKFVGTHAEYDRINPEDV